MIKRPENEECGTVVVRVFCASDKSTVCEIKTKYPITRVELLTLDERVNGEASFDERSFKFALEPCKIATFKLTFEL